MLRPCAGTTAKWALSVATTANFAPHVELPVFAAEDVAAVLPDHDLWDMWHITDEDGGTVIRGGRSWWFYLAAPYSCDPEARHNRAHIRLLSYGIDGWRDHGRSFETGFTPGNREWSGSAVWRRDGVLELFFTATGRCGLDGSFEQRLFDTSSTFAVMDDEPRFGPWRHPVETVQADGTTYAVAADLVASDRGITGFRDPCYFRDPVDDREYLLFTANAAFADEWPDGVIGLAERGESGWRLREPILSAIGVNSELERPHIVFHAGRYYLFWSTHSHRFAPGIDAPSGLYGMVADQFDGSWRPVNGSGLVASNPAEAPIQGYCWWVTRELTVASFVNYWRGNPGAEPVTPESRRAAFGGVPAPFFRLKIDNDRIRIA